MATPLVHPSVMQLVVSIVVRTGRIVVFMVNVMRDGLLMCVIRDFPLKDVLQHDYDIIQIIQILSSNATIVRIVLQ